MKVTERKKFASNRLLPDSWLTDWHTAYRVLVYNLPRYIQKSSTRVISVGRWNTRVQSTIDDSKSDNPSHD